MLVAGQNGLPAIPRYNRVHVIRRWISLRGVRVGKRSQQIEARWRDGDLFLNFPDQGFSERLMLLLMATGKTPKSGIGCAVRTRRQSRTSPFLTNRALTMCRTAFTRCFLLPRRALSNP